MENTTLGEKLKFTFGGTWQYCRFIFTRNSNTI